MFLKNRMSFAPNNYEFYFRESTNHVLSELTQFGNNDHSDIWLLIM